MTQFLYWQEIAFIYKTHCLYFCRSKIALMHLYLHSLTLLLYNAQYCLKHFTIWNHGGRSVLLLGLIKNK
jgi:hypothetical protein